MKTIPDNSQVIKQIHSRLEPGKPVLLRIRGKHFSSKKQNGKAPILNGWQKITPEQTLAPEYQTGLIHARAIGVALVLSCINESNNSSGPADGLLVWSIRTEPRSDSTLK